MSAMASLITGVSIVCSTVCSGADPRKHQSSVSLAFVRGIHQWPVNSPPKRPVKRKMVPSDDVIIRWYHPPQYLVNRVIWGNTKFFMDDPIHCEAHKILNFLLQWRHNGRDSVSNHQPRECLVNRLIRCRSKKTSKLRVTGLCAGNSLETGEFPAQRASNAENVFIWWRHHAIHMLGNAATGLLGVHQ